MCGQWDGVPMICDPCECQLPETTVPEDYS